MTITLDRPMIAILRLEGAAALAAGLAGFALVGGHWQTFALLVLAPDLAMLAYLLGPRAGARAYNLAHSHVGPALLAAVGLWLAPGLLPVACIWLAHIGFDRAMGYGLKSERMFGITHLGRIGKG